MSKKSTTPETKGLPTELVLIAEKSEMALPEAQAIGAMFAPHMLKVNELTELINEIPTENPSVKDAALARKLRLELVSSRGKNGLLEVHKKAKESILVRGRLIDSYKNVVEDSSKIAELRAEGIEKYSENQERIRLDAVETERLGRLESFGTIKYGVNIRLMDDETFEQYFNNEKLLFDAQERERIEAEQREIELKDLVKNRTKQLVDAGAKFDGESFKVDGAVLTDLIDLSELNDVDFNSRLDALKRKIVQLNNEQLKRDKELAAFKKAEEDKKDLLISRFNIRSTDLVKIGFTFEDSSKLFKSGEHASIPSSLIVNMEDKPWKEYLKSVTDAVNDYKAQLELSNSLAVTALLKLSELGFDGSDRSVINKELDWIIPDNQYENFKSEQELNDWLSQQQLQHAKLRQAKLDADASKLQREKDEKTRLEAERLSKGTDQQKVTAFYSQFKDFKFPSLTSDAGKTMESRINAGLEELRKLIISEAKGLV